MSFPSEVIIHILKFLDVEDSTKCSSVCKTWRAAWAPSVECLRFQGALRSIPEIEMMEIISKFKNLKTIDFSNPVFQVGDKLITHVSKKCSRLERLSLNGCKSITDESLRHLSHRCPLLQRLFLRKCKNITEVGVSYLSSLPNLHTLDLACNPKLPFRKTLEVVSRFSQLRALDISDIGLISDSGDFEPLGDALGLTALMFNRANLDYHSLDFDLDAVRAAFHDSLISLGQTLRVLSVDGNSLVGDDTAAAISAHFRNLEELNISNTLVTKEGLLELSYGEFPLKKFHAAGCSQLGPSWNLVTFAERKPALEMMRLDRERKVAAEENMKRLTARGIHLVFVG